MARSPKPTIVDGWLLINLGSYRVRVDSPEWLEWLHQHDSFSYATPSGLFTCKKEKRTRGSSYWSVYKSVQGKTKKAYLGASEELTLDKLQTITQQLLHNASQPPKKDLPNTDKQKVTQQDYPIFKGIDNELHKRVEAIEKIVKKYQANVHPTSPRWAVAKELLNELESVL